MKFDGAGPFIAQAHSAVGGHLRLLVLRTSGEVKISGLRFGLKCGVAQRLPAYNHTAETEAGIDDRFWQSASASSMKIRTALYGKVVGCGLGKLCQVEVRASQIKLKCLGGKLVGS